MMRKHYRAQGFTLIELVMVIVILGIIAAIAIPHMGGISESSKINATRSEMIMLKRAIVGNSQVTSGGKYIDVGFEGNIGAPPDRLEDLGIKPDSISPFNKYTRIGWNGPYIDTIGSSYITDAWGNAYVYDPGNRTIKSIGGSDTLIINF